MANNDYIDPEERLELVEQRIINMEKMLKSIKSDIGAMNRRATVAMIFRLIRLTIIASVIIFLFLKFEPLIGKIGELSVQLENGEFNGFTQSTDGQSGFGNIQETTGTTTTE